MTVKSLMLTSFYQVSSAVMELWQKSFFLEEDDDELEMAYYMVCLQPKRPVYHGRFSMDDFCEPEFLANFRFTHTHKRINKLRLLLSVQKIKNKTCNKIHKIRA